MGDVPAPAAAAYDRGCGDVVRPGTATGGASCEFGDEAKTVVGEAVVGEPVDARGAGVTREGEDSPADAGSACVGSSSNKGELAGGVQLTAIDTAIRRMGVRVTASRCYGTMIAEPRSLRSRHKLGKSQ